VTYKLKECFSLSFHSSHIFEKEVKWHPQELPCQGTDQQWRHGTPVSVEDMALSISPITMRNKVGESTEPCLTPLPCSKGALNMLLISTAAFVLVYQLLIILHPLPQIPALYRHFKSTGFLMVSKAYSRSNI